MPQLGPGARLRALRERAGIARDKLARLAGIKAGTTIQKWEDDESRQGRLFPYSDLAKLVVVLVGKGEPPIAESEIWALCDPATMIDDQTPMRAVPVVEWEEMKARKARENLETVPRGFVRVPASEAGPRCVSALIPDDHASLIAPVGSLVVVDPDQTELRDGQRFIVRIDGAPRLILYRSNPARLEFESAVRREAIFPQSRIEVIGRAITVISKL